MHLAPWNFSSPLLVESHGERGKEQRSRFCFRICSVELFKLITCGKPWRAPKAAAAVRFFDDDARNLYGGYLRNINANMRRTSPKPALRRRGKFRASGRKRSRRCGNFDAQPSRIKTRAFLFGGRAALAVRNKKRNLTKL